MYALGLRGKIPGPHRRPRIEPVPTNLSEKLIIHGDLIEYTESSASAEGKELALDPKIQWLYLTKLKYNT